MTENLLHLETSPYLLQHRDNPVHWIGWGDAAFGRARRENKPILLSIGYAACHWCHVMAHESFEDDEVAALMNELFVNVKVDREERPDIDRIYMAAVQALGEHGGWPLTMFLNPDGEPFWGGTYFPKLPRYGRPGFIQVLTQIAQVYREEPDKVRQNASAIVAALNERVPARNGGAILERSDLDRVAEQALRPIDPIHGGLQGAPKFPQTPLFELLWRAAIRTGNKTCGQAVIRTLSHISQGGIYDHLGGGFARYSVDERWLAPHFEKMLYDNAQLVSLMTLVWQQTRTPLFKQRIEETCNWVLREMVADGGGFAASLDADSEGEEGTYYVWSRAAIASLLDPDRLDEFCAAYDVTAHGNWEGKVILNRLRALDPADETVEGRLADARSVLLAARNKRIRPGWDDKVLSDWNGLMIAALATAGFVFERVDWMETAIRAFAFIEKTMWSDGMLRHSARLGQVHHAATLDGYANMISAALRLHQYRPAAGYLQTAIDWTDACDTHHWDEKRGAYAFAGKDVPHLIARPMTAADDATPNGNATMLRNLAQLFSLTGQQCYQDRADQLITTFSGDVRANPLGHASFVNAFEQFTGPIDAIIIGDPAGTAVGDLTRALATFGEPDMVISVIAADHTLPAHHPAHGKTQSDGRPTLYICREMTCSAPVTEPSDIAGLLARPTHR